MTLFFPLPLVYTCTGTTFVTYLCFRPQCPLENPLVKLPTTRQASLKPKDQTTQKEMAQKLDDLMKKEPVTPSPDPTTTSRDPRLETRLVTLHHTDSSSSSRTSSETEKEIEQIEDQFRGLQVNKLYQPKVTPSVCSLPPFGIRAILARS